MQILIFFFTLWFGLYLIGRDLKNPQLRYSGLGLIAYAFALVLEYLSRQDNAPDLMLRLHWGILFFPATLWAGSSISMIPIGTRTRNGLLHTWKYGILPLTLFIFLAILYSNLIYSPESGDLDTVGLWLFIGINILPLASTIAAIQYNLKNVRRQPAWGLLLAAAIFFGLGASLIGFPLNWLPRTWAVPAISLDLLLLGFAVVWLDAFKQGESLRLEIVQSLLVAGLTASLFGGQVALVMTIGTGKTFPMQVLLVSTVAVSIIITTFGDPLQIVLDRLVFFSNPNLLEERATYRSAANALPRASQTLDPTELDEETFTRYTRQALSHFGDLPRLTTNPLTRLPVIERRIQVNNLPGHTLERAAELKNLLAESVERLKPPGDEFFGTTDEWRFYNAVYYPYIVGLRPYSRRLDKDTLDDAAREALDWFQSAVPERTLYNWQNAAAQLVAKDLREQHQHTFE